MEDKQFGAQVAVQISTSVYQIQKYLSFYTGCVRDLGISRLEAENTAVDEYWY